VEGHRVGSRSSLAGRATDLSFAKTLYGLEFNNLRDFLRAEFWYEFKPCWEFYDFGSASPPKHAGQIASSRIGTASSHVTIFGLALPFPAHGSEPGLAQVATTRRWRWRKQ